MRHAVAKYEWGTKHTCGACEAVFYDMMKSPPTCPSCGTKIKATSRGSPQPQPKVVVEKSKPAEEIPELDGDEDLPIANGTEDKELLEQVEEDVEDDVKEVLETETGGKPGD